MDSKWNASMMSDTSKPPNKEEGGTIVVDPVGLLNAYEYDMSGAGKSYLNNTFLWYTLTPRTESVVFSIDNSGAVVYDNRTSKGIRPSINLKSEMKIVAGDGSKENPYRLMGDNDTDLQGTKLNIRYSGEYIKFGTGENNLYRIVSHETPGLTKITSAEPLKENGKFKTISFGDTYYYSSTNTIGSFLNGEYLTSGDYLTEEQVNMIEDNYIWYLGKVYLNDNYKLAKYIDVNMSSYTTSIDAKVGLLRVGELMAGQFDILHNNNDYWSLTKDTSNTLNIVKKVGNLYRGSLKYGIKPSINLKSNIIIIGGIGLKNDPFILSIVN